MRLIYFIQKTRKCKVFNVSNQFLFETKTQPHIVVIRQNVCEYIFCFIFVTVDCLDELFNYAKINFIRCAFEPKIEQTDRTTDVRLINNTAAPTIKIKVKLISAQRLSPNLFQTFFQSKQFQPNLKQCRISIGYLSLSDGTGRFILF